MVAQYKDPIASVIEVSDRGGLSLAVTLQDQTTGVLDLPMLLEVSTPTLAADTVVDTNTVTLTAGHGLTTGANLGDILEIASTVNGSFFIQCEIISVLGDVVTVDCPVSHIFTTTESVVIHSKEQMNVDGSVTPVKFSVAPLSNQKGDMTRIIFEFRDTSDMDFETFGGGTALTNGLVIRINNGDGTYRNLYNFKSNGDIIEQCFDHSFDNNLGNTIHGFAARLTWAGQSKHGVAVRLDGSLGTGESVEGIVQDDLTGMDRLHITLQGSELQGD